MQTDFLDAAVTEGKLSVFSLYADFQASVHARWCAGTITRIAGGRWQCTSEMWKLDSLAASKSIRKMITADAANADVLVIAVSDLDQSPSDLIGWLGSVSAAPNHFSPALLIGLVGDEENRAQELDWTINELIRCARKINRDFIWHWMGKDAMSDSVWLTDNIGMLLARKHFPQQPALIQEPVVGVE